MQAPNPEGIPVRCPREILHVESSATHGLEDEGEIPRLLKRRGIDPDSSGGLPCTMATCGVLLLGGLILRIPSAIWARACGRGGTLISWGSVLFGPVPGPQAGLPKPRRSPGNT